VVEAAGVVSVVGELGDVAAAGEDCESEEIMTGMTKVVRKPVRWQNR
jgi:hypothetical protein